MLVAVADYLDAKVHAEVGTPRTATGDGTADVSRGMDIVMTNDTHDEAKVSYPVGSWSGIVISHLPMALMILYDRVR